jgi:GntR family transcriptional regulator
MIKRIPRYLHVYNALKQGIETLEFKIGEYLPPEPELEKRFNVSRTTVRKAVELLEDQGFVHIQQGRGTSILDYKATQRLQYVTSFSETLQEQGFDVSHQVFGLERLPAPVQVADALEIASDSELIQVKRLAYANSLPIAIMINYLVPDLVPGIEEKSGKIGSLYHFLEREYSLYIDAATDCISAVTAEVKEAEQLLIPAGEPLLVVRRISYRDRRPVEYADLRIVAEKYEYSVHTKERPPRGF